MVTPDHMPEVVGLCPDPNHTQEFYMPHAGHCPMEHADGAPRLVVYHRTVTDEMVERAALGLRNFEASDRGGMAHCDSLDSLLEPDYYRKMARAALVAALDGGERACG